MKLTKTSNNMYPIIIKLNSVIDEAGSEDLKTFAIRARTMCPALIFATNRTVKVKGRIIILIVSIITKNGINTIGAPDGARCATVCLGEFNIPDNKRDSHKRSASDLLNHKLDVTPYTYGVKPIRLFKIRNSIKPVNNSFNGLNDCAPFQNLEIWLRNIDGSLQTQLEFILNIKTNVIEANQDQIL